MMDQRLPLLSIKSSCWCWWGVWGVGGGDNLKKMDFFLELTCVHFKGDFLANLGQKTVKHKWSTYFRIAFNLAPNSQDEKDASNEE